MWLGLLGTLHVEHDDAVIPVPAAKQRVMLAALTMQPNRVVSFDELTDAVWGDKAPPAARATLRNYVKRLRQGLGPEMASRIKTHDPGYRIELDEAELDLAQFTRLCAARRRGGTVRAVGAGRRLLGKPWTCGAARPFLTYLRTR